MMDRLEMMGRLDAGESAIEIAVDKYQRVLKFIDAGGDPHTVCEKLLLHTTEANCPLCEVHSENCKGCWLMGADEFGCADEWNEMHDALVDMDLVRAKEFASALLEKLENGKGCAK